MTFSHALQCLLSDLLDVVTPPFECDDDLSQFGLSLALLRLYRSG